MLLSILEQLIALPSITPQDAGCQEYLIKLLEQWGFSCKRFNHDPVSNFFASYGNDSPLLVFAGHTDVVPVGDLDKWQTPPFQLSPKDDLLFARGIADMKGSLAAMMEMAYLFSKNKRPFKGSLGFLITSGEEGDHFDLGTPYVMQQLSEEGIKIDYCIVGEPSSSESIADMIKIGRRGSLTATVQLEGIQGHVAYPHLAKNPIHMLAPALAKLTAIEWDQGNQFFPPTTLQITAINAGGQANNIIPGILTFSFNIRFSTEQNVTDLQNRVLQCFNEQNINPKITWKINGHPFLTQQGALLNTAQTVIEQVIGKKPILSTSGGTSDGRFIAPYGVEVIELGPINTSIHKVNECCRLSDLQTLRDLYLKITEALLF